LVERLGRRWGGCGAREGVEGRGGRRGALGHCADPTCGPPPWLPGQNNKTKKRKRPAGQHKQKKNR
jgi:hypothetical protein